MRAVTWIRLSLTIAALATFAYAAYDALSFALLARYMPLTISLAGLLLTALSLYLDVRGLPATEGSPPRWASPEDAFADEGAQPANIARQLYHGAWIAFFIILIAALGVVAAVAIFTALFLRLEAKMGWRGVLLSTLLATGCLLGLSRILELHWPATVLGDMIGPCG